MHFCLLIILSMFLINSQIDYWRKNKIQADVAMEVTRFERTIHFYTYAEIN